MTPGATPSALGGVGREAAPAEAAPPVEGAAPAAGAAPAVGPGRRAALVAEAARMLLALAVVTAATALLLVALDALPSLFSGVAQNVRRARSVEELERRLRARLVLPAYFPQTLAWPPRRLRFVLRPPGAAALHVEARDGTPRLLFVQTAGPGEIPEALVPEAQVRDRSEVAVGAATGALARVVEDGAQAWQVTWTAGDRTYLLRSRGSLDELLRIARSVRPKGPT